MTTATATKSRTVRLAETDGGKALVIREEKGSTTQVDAYFLSELASVSGRIFLLAKHDGTRYAVRVNGQQESCECLGHRHYGHKTVCKHRAALKSLIAGGKL